MVASNAGRRRRWRIALAALTFGTIAAAGIATAPAKADDHGHRGWDHHGWGHRDHDWGRDHWRGWGWGWHRPYRYSYGYGWYDPPPVYYEPAPPVYYAPPPAYYGGGLSVYIPLR